jgi:hypothetical protein
MLMRHGNVDAGKHHENEGLEQDDQDVKDCPTPVKHSGRCSRNNTATGKSTERAEQAQQHEDQFAGIHIAEQPHGERDRFGQVFDQVECEIRDPQQRMTTKGGGEQFVHETACALRLETEKYRQQKYRQRHGKCGVQVGGRHRLPMMQARRTGGGGNPVDGQKIHQVHQKDPDEYRQGERREKLSLTRKYTLDGIVDKLDDQFDESLNPPRHTGGGATCNKIEEADTQQAGKPAHQYRVQMESPKAFAEAQVGKVVAYVFARAVGGLTGSHDDQSRSLLLTFKQQHRQGLYQQYGHETCKHRPPQISGH